MPDLDDGARAMEALRRAILDTKRLEADVAKGILSKAQSNARRRPTPQARMVASGMVARRGVVIGFASKRILGSGGEPVKLGHLAYGSEFGSNTHRQFGPRRESGYWLHPAAEEPNREIDKAEDDYLDDATAIRTAGL
jgi:hypothetical protein